MSQENVVIVHDNMYAEDVLKELREGKLWIAIEDVPEFHQIVFMACNQGGLQPYTEEKDFMSYLMDTSKLFPYLGVGGNKFGTSFSHTLFAWKAGLYPIRAISPSQIIFCDDFVAEAEALLNEV